MVRLAGVSNAGKQKLLDNALRSNKKSPSLFAEAIKTTHVLFRPGKSLDQMTSRLAKALPEALETHLANYGNEVDLWQWVKHAVTLGVTEALYGPMNPFRDAQVADAYWLFSDGMGGMLPGLFQRYMAPRAFSGREKLTAAYVSYLAAENHQQSSESTKAWLRVLEAHSLSREDIARIECTRINAILSNTVGLAFWTVLSAISDSQLLRRLQDEAASLSHLCALPDQPLNDIGNAKPVEEGLGKETSSSNVIEMPLLRSLFRECTRRYTCGAESRVVVHDASVGDFLFKKDSTVLCPMRSVHFSRKIYGPNYNQLEPERFLKIDDDVNIKNIKGFGGGKFMCPGRFFAERTVLLVVRQVCMQYNVIPVSGKWVAPGEISDKVTLGVAMPRSKVVVIAKRN
ncbi:MAG: hypothetical protein Q9162_002448 [Coniocarpon cinnabarinum]